MRALRTPTRCSDWLLGVQVGVGAQDRRGTQHEKLHHAIGLALDSASQGILNNAKKTYFWQIAPRERYVSEASLTIFSWCRGSLFEIPPRKGDSAMHVFAECWPGTDMVPACAEVHRAVPLPERQAGPSGPCGGELYPGMGEALQYECTKMLDASI